MICSNTLLLMNLVSSFLFKRFKLYKELCKTDSVHLTFYSCARISRVCPYKENTRVKWNSILYFENYCQTALKEDLFKPPQAVKESAWLWKRRCFFFFFFWPWPRHVESPRPRIKPVPQQQPHGSDNTGSSTCWATGELLTKVFLISAVIFFILPWCISLVHLNLTAAGLHASRHCLIYTTWDFLSDSTALTALSKQHGHWKLIIFLPLDLE